MELPAALVDAIREGGDAARLVAADWLLERGESAHGELIATMVRAPDDAVRIDALIARLVGDLPLARAGWRAGFLDRIAIVLRHTGDIDGLYRLLEHPVACALRAIECDGPGGLHIPTVFALASPTLRVASLVPSSGSEWTGADELVALRIVGSAGFAHRFPALEELDVNVANEGLRDLVAPRLQRLRIASTFRGDTENLARIDPQNVPALAHLAIAGADLSIAQIRALPIVQRVQTLEIVTGAAGERDRRWFPIDRGPRDLRGLLDLGVSAGSQPGKLLRLDENPGRHDIGKTRIEHTGVDWWVRDAPATTRINGQVLAHVRLLPGDRIEIDGVAYRAVGEHEDLAALRARTALPDPTPRR